MDDEFITIGLLEAFTCLCLLTVLFIFFDFKILNSLDVIVHIIVLFTKKFGLWRRFYPKRACFKICSFYVIPFCYWWSRFIRNNHHIKVVIWVIGNIIKRRNRCCSRVRVIDSNHLFISIFYFSNGFLDYLFTYKKTFVRLTN